MSEEVREESGEGGARFSTTASQSLSVEIVGVPSDLRAEARTLVKVFADVMRQKPELASRPVLAVLVGASVVVARLEDGGPVGGQGILSRWLGSAPPRMLRLCSDEPDGGSLPRAALESIVLENAVRVLDDGDSYGLEMLRASARRFPGAPNRVRHSFGPQHNIGNSRVHMELALREPGRADAARHFALALERSALLSIIELGDPLESFADISHQHVVELSRFIVHHSLRQDPIRERISPRLASLRSPIWYLGPRGTVARGTGQFPAAFLDLYFREEPARVLATAFASDVVVEAVARHKRRPAELAARVLPVVRIWREVRPSHLVDTQMPFIPATRLISVLLAAVGVGVAAGMTEREIRAWLGASDDPEHAESAAAKLDRIEGRIARWTRDATSSSSR